MGISSLTIDETDGTIITSTPAGAGMELHDGGSAKVKLSTSTEACHWDVFGQHMFGATFLSDYGPYTANHTIAGFESMVRCDPTSGAFTISLPSTIPGPVGSGLWFCIIKNVTSSTHTITISPNGHQIDGSSSSLTISSGFGSVRIFADTANYFTW